jgi:hypothetical protein
LDSTSLRCGTRSCPGLAEEEYYLEPAWDKSGSEGKIVVEVEHLLRGGKLIALFHDEFDQIDLVLLPKGIGQILEDLVEGQRDRRGKVWWKTEG